MTALIRWADDRINPILVKEVRQAVRSRYFWGTYALALVIACLAGAFLLTVVDDPDELGQIFFGVVYFCLAASVMGLVPFQSFLAAGGNWDTERTQILMLTALRPRQVVLGRLLASMTQIGLMFLALLPFLGLAFLLPGVDLAAFGISVVTVLLFGTFLSCVTIAASWLSANRLVRVLLMTVIGGGLLWCVGVAVALGAELIDSPDAITRDEFWWVWSALVGHGAAVGAFGFAAATARIGHPEENRTLPLRVLTVGVVVVALGGLYALDRAGHGEEEAAIAICAYLCLALTVPFTGFLTEPERMGRRAWIDVPRRLALFTAPFQPGGSNGFLLMISLTTLMAVTLLAAPPMTSLSPGDWDWYEVMNGILTAITYLVISVGFPTAFFNRWTDRTAGRLVAVASVPVFCLACLLLPTMYGAISGDWDLQEFRHVGNPFWTMERALRDHDAVHPLLMVGVAVTILVNLPRVFRGLRRLGLAEKESRDRAARR